MSSFLNITGLYEPQEINLNVNIDEIARNINEINNDLIYFKVETEGNIDSINSNITDLTTDLNEFKIETNDNIDSINSSITDLNTALTNFETQANNNFTSINNSFTELSTDINLLDQATSNNFDLTNDYIDAKHQEGKDYTDTEVENLRNEGLIQEAVSQLLAWITSDEGKRFRKKVWDRISSKWASFTGSRPYTELLDDVQQATTDELDKMLEVYRYIDNGFNTGNAGIRTNAITSKNIILNGSTLIYNGDLYLTGNINKGSYSGTTFTEQDTLNDYMVMKGTKLNSCLEIEEDKKLRLNFDTNDFELGLSPTYNLKLKNDYKISGVSSPLSKDTNNILHLDYDTDFFEIVNSYFRPKFDATDVEDTGPLFIDFSTRKLRTKYNDTLQINASKELGTTFNCKGLKTGSSLSIDPTSKLLDLNYDTEYFDVSLNKLTSKALIKGVLVNNCIALDENNKLFLKFDANDFQQSVSKDLQIKITGNSLSKTSTGLKVNLGDNSIIESASGLKVNLGDTSLSVGVSGLSVSSIYKTELQDLKTDTQTFKTQAETAKTQAETAKTQAELAKTTATAQAEIATSQAGIATSQATTATTQAGIATTQAGIATTQATASAASAVSAGASATTAGASATAAAASAAAAAFSATFFQKGDKGDTGDTGPQGPAGDPRLAENPFFIENNTIKLKKDNTLFISGSTGNLGVVGSNITQLDYNNITLNKPSFLQLSGGTLTGSLNITSPNTVLDFGVRLEDNLINLCGASYGFGINNGTLRYNAPTNATHKFYVGITNTATIDNSGFRGAGANITGINYDNITLNKPNLALYDLITDRQTAITTLANSKQNTLTASTILEGIGSNITQLDYNKLINVPSSSTLTFSSPLSMTNNVVSINLSSYLALSGGTLTGSLNITSPNTVLNFGVRLEDNLINLCGASYGFGINNGTLRYNAPTGATHKFYLGATNTATIDNSGFRGAGANITGINYDNITLNKPNLALYDLITDRQTEITSLSNTLQTNINTKQNTLTASTILSGIGSNITQLDYNKLINVPSTSSTLTFNSPLSVSANVVSINLSSYLTTANASTTYLSQASATETYLSKVLASSTYLTSATGNATYLQLTGGTLTGSLTVPSSINISGATTSPQSLFFRGQDYNIGIAGSAGNYSSSAIQNDMIIRTLTGTNLYLQCGTGGHALRIHTNNKISTTGDLTLGNGAWLSVGSGDLPTCPLNVGNNVVSNRIISLYDLANNNFQFTGFGNNNGLSFNIPASTNNFRFLVGSSTTTSTEVLRITGNGDLLLLAPNIANPLTIAEQRIINNGSFLSAVFGGDSLISSYWGVAININSGGLGDNGNAGATKILNSASFTINTRSSGSTTSFDRTLFTVRNGGSVGIGTTNPTQLLEVYTDNTSVNNFIKVRANTAREAGLILDRSGTFWTIFNKGTGYTGSVNNLCFFNSSSSSILELTQGGNVGIGSAAPLTKLEVSGTTPTVAIKGSSEADRAILYFATPFTNTSAYKCALIAEGMSTWSRSKLHFCLDNTGDNTSTYNASLTNSRMTINYDGSVGIGNSLSTAPLWIGRPDIASNGFIVISRNNGGGGNRNGLIGYTSSFFISIGDYGNVNSTANTNVPQFVMIYNAPSSSIFVETSGRTVFQYGFGSTSSDERIKTNIKTIENALDKVLLLRGVEYNDIRIEPDEKRFGLIAQEVELIIPEIVNDNEHLKHKTLDYVSLIPYLIEAVKEQQKQINEMKELLKKNNII